jgi:hypothetical protein
MMSYLDIEDALQGIDRYGLHVRDIGLLVSALAGLATTVMGVGSVQHQWPAAGTGVLVYVENS